MNELNFTEKNKQNKMEKIQPSSSSSKNNSTTLNPAVKTSNIERKRRSNKSRNKRKAKKRRLTSKTCSSKVKVNSAMGSSYMYTKASEWQYKHEIAFWKAKAKALECENRILHDIIKRKSGSLSSGIGASTSTSVSESESGDEGMSSASEDEMLLASREEFKRNVRENEELEVSEAYIEFLTMNAKYKEDARRERERLRSKTIETEEERVKRMEKPPTTVDEDNSDELERLYGERWKRISALEMSLQCQFMSDCDSLKPVYWPNIPLNFNFSQ